MAYPTDLPTHDDFINTETLADAQHAAKHNAIFDELEALEAKVGIDSSADTSSHDYKLATSASHIANTSNPHTVTKTQLSLGNVDNTSDATKLAATLLAVYPVGAIYISVVSTSPATLFGGTWVAFGAGKTMVGLDSTDTDFDTAEETGGAKTVTLTSAQSGVPAHNHYMQYPANAGSGGLGAGYGLGYTAGDRYPTGNTGIETTGETKGWGLQATTAANAAEAHTNLQPYIVTYMWKRTA